MSGMKRFFAGCIAKKKRLLTVFLAAAVLTAALPLSVFASKETEEKIKKAKEEKEQTENAIENNQQNIDSMNSTKTSLQGELKNLNGQLSEISDNLSQIESNIKDKQQEIADTTADLEEAQRVQDAQYEAMKKRVQFMYFNSRSLPVEAFFDSTSFGDFLNRQDYIEALSAYDRKMLEQYIETKESVAEKKVVLEQEEADLQGLKDEALSEQGRVSGLVSQTSSSISSYEGQIADAERTADALQAELDVKNQEIKALEAKLAEERRLEELSRRSVWRSIGEVTFAEGDEYLLANLIYCEAGNQPYEGQVAVGAVVLNRVMSGAFPDTIVGVIYQRGQFEPVSTGRLALALSRDDATPACYQAAQAAMAGQTTVADCIFFRTPIPQVTPRYTIGGHIFY